MDMQEIYARFNYNPNKIAAWANLLMLVPNTDSPRDVLYSRAIPTLLKLKNDLVRTGWIDVSKDHLPPGILFMVESPVATLNKAPPSPSVMPANGTSPFFASTTSSPKERLRPREEDERVIFALPSELSAFLEYQEDIQEILHDRRLFTPSLDQHGHPVLTASDELDPMAAPALKHIFYLLQLIVPGMFLLVHDSLSFSRKPFSLSFPPSGTRRREQRSDPWQNSQDSTASRGSTTSTKVSLRRTRRALPPAEWIEKRMVALEEIFGKHSLHDLLNCARDVEFTVWTTFHSPEGDQLETGSDAGFDSSVDLNWNWPENTLEDEIPNGIDIPSKPSAVTPGIDRYDRTFPHMRLARSL